MFISDSASDYVPTSPRARAAADLVIGVGFLMGDALSTVAKQFPDTNFAIVDFPWAALKDKPANARGLVFAEQEAGYLVGVAAATAAGGGSVSAVGGQAVPAVVAFLAGYRTAVQDTDPGMTVQQGYSQDFVEPSEVQGARSRRSPEVRRRCSRQTGVRTWGRFRRAQERDVWGIGVDNDQSFLGPHILTSAMKKVDVAVFDTIEAVTRDSFEGGGDTLYDVVNGGVGYGKVSADAPDRDALIAKLDGVSEQIASGDVDIPRR